VGDRLQGRVALITGSDSGIGQGTAIEMAREGADIVIHFRSDRAGAEETQRAVEAAGRRAAVVEADVSDESQVERMFDEAIAAFGGVDILVNNAGMNLSGTHVADMETAEWDRLMRTNLYGYFFTCRRFIRERRKAGGRGKIINVTSVHDLIPMVGAGAYDASKGGQLNLTRTLALELAPDRINVNTIGPGMILTPFNQEAVDDPEVRDEQVQSIPMKRAAKPEEIARLAVFLASPDAEYVTGATYVMDGGLAMNQAQGA
jgi:glucose 1-dehydrogenase